jgi:hypothetical protein
MLFRIMWATAHTPDSWKENLTILLYKNKGETTDPSKYRPIALLDTLYKLWTSLQAKVLSDFAEEHSILSSQQAGFRRFHNTTQQLQLFTSALEDARLTGQNIYALLVDFTSAFNMIDHPTLFFIMQKLGFPQDAMAVIKDLYRGATSRVQWATTTTTPIPIHRGTMQGDSLSPFLFLLYLEPLLSWLHTGGRGYKFGCIKDTPLRNINHLSSTAYADDLSIITNNLSDIHIQAAKLSAFCTWAHLPINAIKTIVTGILHNNIITNSQTPKQAAAHLQSQLQDSILIQNQYATYHPPHAPFTHLGVDFTMTLDWSHQHSKVRKMLAERVDLLNQSYATTPQKRHILKTSIIPAVAYSFPCTPYTPPDLQALDLILRRAAKQAFNLPTSTYSAILHEDTSQGGLGYTSVKAEYVTRNVQSLFQSLQHPGRIGNITRALLPLQIQRVGYVSPTQQATKTAKYCQG